MKPVRAAAFMLSAVVALLTTSANSEPAPATTDEPQPLQRAGDTPGACCFGCDINDMATPCQQLTRDQCCAADGLFLGENIGCQNVGHTVGPCAAAFEDIAATGTNANLADESSVEVPLGFTFSFYGVDTSSVWLVDNGLVTFDQPPATTFDQQQLPNPTEPNRLIAPWWEDLDPGAGGAVYYETKGTAPNRRFIAQWDSVPQFFAADSNTFQVVLFEGSNSAEFRYGAISPPDFQGDVTVGVESAGGILSDPIDPATIAPGTCIELAPDPTIEATDFLCRGDLDGSGEVDIFDFATLADNFGRLTDATRCDGDYTCDGLVNAFDFAELADTFGCSRVIVVEQCCAPIAACQFCDATCQDTTRVGCDQLGGAWNNTGQLCSEIVAEGAGGCCLPNETCADSLSMSSCSVMGGGYLGDCSSCDLTGCGVGVCCLCTGECRDEIDAVMCAQLGGRFTASFDCLSLSCGDPIGACCLCDGICNTLTEDGCASLGGIYQGDCADCETADCMMFGACCLPDGACEMTDQETCETSLGGLYQGDCSTCATSNCQLGACCLCDVTCTDGLDAAACAEIEGTHALATNCQTVFCERFGACCLDDGTCADRLTELECTDVALSGSYQGDCTECSVAVCDLGACCLCDGMCIDDTDKDACDAMGGRFEPNKACQDVACAPVGACCLNDGMCADGVAELFCTGDLQGVLWLECQECQGVGCP